MKPSDFIFGPMLTLTMVVGVGASLLAQNLRTRGPFVTVEKTIYDTWNVRTTVLGWPLAYHKRIEATPSDWIYDSYEYLKTPKLQWQNPQTLSLVANVTLGVVMLISTNIVVEYWRLHRTGPLQFGLRAMLVATTVVAVVVALIDNELMHWSILLMLPIAFGIICIPAMVGLWMHAAITRAERKQRDFRTRFTE